MTGHFPITVSPSAALDIVKPDGLIPLAKGPYLPSLAFGRPGGVAGDTFSTGARSISNVPSRHGDAGRQGVVQEGVWIR